MSSPKRCGECGRLDIKEYRDQDPKPCGECGALYIPSKYRANTSRFCSRRCQCTWNAKENAKKMHDKWDAESPEESKQKLKNKIEGFFEKTDGCWIWKGNTKKGYGRFTFRGVRNIRAHRASYEVYKGKIPKGKIIMHTCDMPSCVNPDHLRIGTHQENVADRVAKGRSGSRKNSGFKLMVEQVNEIRRLLQTNKSIISLSKDFGVSENAISAIKNRKTWNNINKFSIEQIKEIRRLLSAGTMITKISKDFNVSRQTIHRLKTGKTWSDITIEQTE